MLIVRRGRIVLLLTVSGFGISAKTGSGSEGCLVAIIVCVNCPAAGTGKSDK